MALIIPEAQSEASIVQQPRISPQAADFGGVGAFGNVFVELGAKKVAAENDRIVRQARLSTIQALDEARLKYETTGELENLTGSWEAEAAAITAKAAEAVPVHMRKDFAVAMEEMVAPQTSAIRRREFALFQDRETAALNADMRGFERAAAAAPTPEAREKIFGEMAASIGRAVDNGILSAVEADKWLSDVPANTAKIEAAMLLEEDPAAYQERAEEFAALLPPEMHADFLITSKRLVEAEAVKVARQAELDAKKADNLLGKEVDDAIEVIEAGLPFKGQADLMDKVRGTDHADRLQGAIDAAAVGGNFALLPPSEQEKVIADMEKTPTGNPADVGRLNRLKEMNKRTVEALATDPLAYIRERGINPVEPVDISDKASVQNRRAVAEEGYRIYTPGAATIKYFDQAEADRLGAILSGPDPDAALGVIANIMNTFDEAAPAALAQLGEKDPLGLMAGALVLDTGDPTAARTMLTGRKFRAEGKAATVAAELRRAVAADLAPLFPATPDGQARLKTLLDGADLYYAAAGIGIADPKSQEARIAYLTGANALLGEQNWGNGQKSGGVQEVNGTKAILPARMSAAEVEQAVNYFTADAWKRAGGSVPRWGSNGNSPEFTSFSAGDRAKVAVLSLGQGIYTLTYNGRPLYDPAQRDGIYRFDLELLVKGTNGQ